jgi:hypothetical protein
MQGSGGDCDVALRNLETQLRAVDQARGSRVSMKTMKTVKRLVYELATAKGFPKGTHTIEHLYALGVQLKSEGIDVSYAFSYVNRFYCGRNKLPAI